MSLRRSKRLKKNAAGKTFLSHELEEKDFCFLANPKDLSELDTLIQTSWDNKMDEGWFRYELGDLKTKRLPGKYNFIVQLNINRALERRTPQPVTDVVMDFDPERFHFGKIDKNEVMFTITATHWETEETFLYSLMINVSPLEYCHSLLVPCIEKNLPQVLNFEALRMSVELMLASRSCYFRIGFNSLGGFASVNHLHLHAYYLKHNLYLEDAAVNQLKGQCYELVDFPSKGFVFEVLEKESIVEVVRSAMLLIDFLIEKKIAHNVFVTRGMPFSWPIEIWDPADVELCSVRIYVWAREACFGVKDEKSFNIAVCELAGHIPMKDKKSFETITEDEIAERLSDVCQKTFVAIREQVRRLYTVEG